MISVGSPGGGGDVITEGTSGKASGGGDVITEGTSGKASGDGDVITEGTSGKASGDGESMVGVPVGVVVLVESSIGPCCVRGTTGAAVVGVVSVTGAEVGGPWASWRIPQRFSAMRTAMGTPHPTNAISLRHRGIGAAGSGCRLPALTPGARGGA